MAVNPADSAIYGALFGSDAMRALFSDERRLQAMLDVEAALARVEARLGIIPKSAAAAIAKAAKAENLSLPVIAKGTALIGVPAAAVARALGTAAGGDAPRYVHWGATSQDIVDTALVLQLREALDLIEDDLKAVGDALAAQARAHRRTVMAGRTYLQQALPITFGYKCAVWLVPLAAHRRRLAELRRRLLVVQFGGAVGTLASLGAQGRAVTEGLARELGLAAPSAPWHANRETMAETAAVLGLVCGSLAKFATDTILLSQTEVAEAAEPQAEGRGGSSTLPQKRNPVASAYIVACTRGVHALVPLMFQALVGDHERSTGAWQSEPLALPQIFVLTSGALMHARDVAKGLRVDAAAMKRNLGAARGLIMAEAVMMALAETAGRDEAHRLVERASHAALVRGRSLAEALAADSEIAAHLDAKVIARLTDPARYLGEATAVVNRVLAVWRASATAK
ncbi:MAG: 3-carboxy-cis,cis-muconate cycloisomerase [Alphaproteobacteria bacterium]|nr:3-carboxy-cis,cis-muconate cycloisomerase [Alphaproteobacteria bacterium]